MLLLAADNPLDRVLDALARLPWAAHAAVGIVLLAGLVLWATGRHVLRPTVGFCSGAVGALIGLMAIPVLAPDTGVSPLVGALGGMILGLLAGFILYKLAVSLTFGLSLGSATGLLAIAVLASPLGQRIAHNSPTSNDTSGRPIAAAQPADAPAQPPLPPTLSLSPAAHEVEQIRQSSVDFTQSLRYAAEFEWEDLSPKHRWIVLGAATLAAGLGVLLGIALPAWAAGAVTALVGSALWIPSGIWLARAAGVPGPELLAGLAPAGWAIIWLVTASVGLGIQWMGLIKTPKPKPAPEA